MRKLIICLLCLACIFSLTACGDRETKVEVTNVVKEFSPIGEKTLFVGDHAYFVNSKDTQEEVQYLTYIADVKYTLYRSYYQNGNDSYVQIGNYYYYWQTDITYDELYLGKCNTITTITHNFYTFGEENENIVVKTKKEVESVYTYQGGARSMTFTFEVNLNGYYASFAELAQASSLLASQINRSGIKQYYVDTTYPTSTTYDVQSFTGTFFYFE